eukprot:TRINITY_DN2572_c0_g1_i3.p1 TRINITY_DN2572_c0_g1~~TRINITY_DN2572_c0_g1_i3.p1  ORF type:complete len:227 (+),score=43.73 TRINITY_DN2572_c0_g1_i3:560-1240(+)
MGILASQLSPAKVAVRRLLVNKNFTAIATHTALSDHPDSPNDMRLRHRNLTSSSAPPMDPCRGPGPRVETGALAVRGGYESAVLSLARELPHGSRVALLALPADTDSDSTRFLDDVRSAAVAASADVFDFVTGNESSTYALLAVSCRGCESDLLDTLGGPVWAAAHFERVVVQLQVSCAEGAAAIAARQVARCALWDSLLAGGRFRPLFAYRWLYEAWASAVLLPA